MVALGDKLDGLYELIEVNQNDAVFRNGQKIYKLENNVKGN